MPMRRHDAIWSACRLLLEHNRMVKRENVVRVDPDAILFLDDDRQPHTAWLTYNRHTQRTDVKVQPGFPAWPDTG